jgi:hypothetical protein
VVWSFTPNRGSGELSEGSVSDDEGSGSDRLAKVGMAPSADEGMGEGVVYHSRLLDEPNPVEACLSMVLHCPVSPMKVGCRLVSDIGDRNPSNFL